MSDIFKLSVQIELAGEKCWALSTNSLTLTRYQSIVTEQYKSFKIQQLLPLLSRELGFKDGILSGANRRFWSFRIVQKDFIPLKQ